MAYTQDKKNSSALRVLMTSDGWTAFLQFAASYSNKIEGARIVGGTAFDTLRMLHINQGKVDGIEELLKELEQYATS